jgi:hypothetical protein
MDLNLRRYSKTIGLALIFVGETYRRKPNKPFKISSYFTASSSSYSNITSNRVINQEEINMVFFFFLQSNLELRNPKNCQKKKKDLISITRLENTN